MEKQFDEMLHEFINLNIQGVDLENEKELTSLYISEKNYQERRNMPGNASTGVIVRVGDICYIDYGKAYQREIGYQHFGLVLSMCNDKIFVVPMTSNKKSYMQAMSEDNPNGKSHLLRFKKVGNMKNDTVLFLNDVKFINPARVIDVKGHISKNSHLFAYIKMAVMNIIMK